MLKDIDDRHGQAAVVQLCGSGEYPPTIAQIRSLAHDLGSGRLTAPSPWEAWERVCDPDCAQSLTDVEKRALKVIGGTWAIKNSDSIGVERSNFVRAYQDFLNTERKRNTAIPEVRKIADDNAPEITPPERRISEPEKITVGTKEEISAMLRKAGF